MGAGDVTQLTARFNLAHGNKLVCVLDEVGQKSTKIVMVRVPTLAPSNLFTPGLYILNCSARCTPLAGPAQALGRLGARADRGQAP